jgi:hypothetical protein
MNLGVKTYKETANDLRKLFHESKDRFDFVEKVCEIYNTRRDNANLLYELIEWSESEKQKEKQ